MTKEARPSRSISFLCSPFRSIYARINHFPFPLLSGLFTFSELNDPHLNLDWGNCDPRWTRFRHLQLQVDHQLVSLIRFPTRPNQSQRPSLGGLDRR